MLRVLIAVALVLGSGFLPEQGKIKPAASKSSDRAVASDYQPSPTYDEPAERQLLDLANQSRAQAGAAPLQFLTAWPMPPRCTWIALARMLRSTMTQHRRINT
ncbi:MAG: hypothetical protein DMG81_09790 [Acidobacteria bacterium]|nr:MAG: hypothetical protein DMG81_09790 [Acidobacteriota bacterium]